MWCGGIEEYRDLKAHSKKIDKLKKTVEALKRSTYDATAEILQVLGNISETLVIVLKKLDDLELLSVPPVPPPPPMEEELPREGIFQTPVRIRL